MDEKTRLVVRLLSASCPIFAIDRAVCDSINSACSSGEYGITTSYNFLVFDQNGNYLPELSSTTNAFVVQQPYQQTGNLSLGTNYQIAITKTTQTDPKAGKIPQTHQLAIYTFLDGA